MGGREPRVGSPQHCSLGAIYRLQSEGWPHQLCLNQLTELEHTNMEKCLPPPVTKANCITMHAFGV